MTHTFKLLSLLSLIVTLFACTNEQSDKASSAAPESDTEITVTGIVQKVIPGKDGYMADIETSDGETAEAMISIVNLGGMDHYQRMNAGDRATIKGTSEKVGDKNYLRVTKILQVEARQTGLTIQDHSFSGVSPGDAIASYPGVLRKDVLRNGEGSFDIYRIINEGSNITAYCLPDPKDKTLVGDMYIVSPGARTSEGIEVGNTFSTLSAKFPTIEIHGSEIEGRTYAKAGNLSYRLDAANFSYEVNKSKIKPTTKITEIVINR